VTTHVLLVVEDEADLRLLVRLQFTGQADFVLDGEASDATSALDLVRRSAPGLIVLDHLLEGDVTGFAVAPAL
jgi:CheY-like chemotaxis protein